MRELNADEICLISGGGLPGECSAATLVGAVAGGALGGMFAGIPGGVFGMFATGVFGAALGGVGASISCAYALTH